VVVRRRVTGNGAQVRAAADGWMDRLAYKRIGGGGRSSDGERLVAGMVAVGLAAVADSVGAAGRRVPNDTATSLPPVQENTVEHNNNNNNNIILSPSLRLLLRRCFYNITSTVHFFSYYIS